MVHMVVGKEDKNLKIRKEVKILITKKNIKELPIEELIDNTATINKEYNDLDKFVKESKDIIKTKMADMSYTESKGNLYTAVISDVVKESLNQERTLKVLHDIGAEWLIQTKEYVDPDELEKSIVIGELDAKLFADCADKKVTKMLKFKKNKKG